MLPAKAPRSCASGCWLRPNGLDLTLQADFGEASPETAGFLTVMPDGYEDQTRYAIGTGRLEETLRYEWHPH